MPQRWVGLPGVLFKAVTCVSLTDEEIKRKIVPLRTAKALKRRADAADDVVPSARFPRLVTPPKANATQVCPVKLAIQQQFLLEGADRNSG